MREPVLGQVWVLRVPRSVWLSPCRLGQALLSAPPSSGRCLVRRPSAFSLPLPFQGLPALGYRCVGVGVFSFFPFFFCVPRLASRLSSCHLIFIVILFSFPFHHLPRCCGACVCVCTSCRDVKLRYFAGGHLFSPMISQL